MKKYDTFYRPHSLMDKTRVCGTLAPGSTPGGGTNKIILDSLFSQQIPQPGLL